MAPLYEVSAEAQNDLFEIWQRIALDSVELAHRIEGDFYRLFDSLGRIPLQGHSRKDLTNRPVLFFPLYSFLVVYRPDARAGSHHGRPARPAECKADSQGAPLRTP
jgi:antitoxin ParD1/3/4